MIRGFARIAACIAGVGRSAVAQHSEDVPFTLTHLALDLRVDYGRRAVDGTATLHLRNVSDRARSDIPLLLNRLMTVSRVLDRAGDSVAFEQRITVFRDDSIRQVNAIVVTPHHPVPPGDSVAVVVHYGGILVGYAETGALYIRDRVSRDFTIVREDAYAFPVVGVPFWKANRAAVREPFTFAARITVPGDVTVAMGGEPTGRAAHDSLVAWTYRSTDPLPFLNRRVSLPVSSKARPRSSIATSCVSSITSSPICGIPEASICRRRGGTKDSRRSWNGAWRRSSTDGRTGRVERAVRCSRCSVSAPGPPGARHRRLRNSDARG